MPLSGVEVKLEEEWILVVHSVEGLCSDSISEHYLKGINRSQSLSI